MRITGSQVGYFSDSNNKINSSSSVSTCEKYSASKNTWSYKDKPRVKMKTDFDSFCEWERIADMVLQQQYYYPFSKINPDSSHIFHIFMHKNMLIFFCIECFSFHLLLELWAVLVKSQASRNPQVSIGRETRGKPSASNCPGVTLPCFGTPAVIHMQHTVGWSPLCITRVNLA